MLYKELIEEQVTIISQYSRFVIQALTAALVFKMLDADESGQIDADELEETVASIFTGKLDKTEVNSLVDITIEASHQQVPISLEDVLADMKHQVKQNNKERKQGIPTRKKQTKTLNLQQFINVFTGPPCTLAGCGALTQQLKRTSEKQAMKKTISERLNHINTYVAGDNSTVRASASSGVRRLKRLNLLGSWPYA